MSLSNLATVFGPTLIRPPVANIVQCGLPVDISQEVDVQVCQYLFVSKNVRLISLAGTDVDLDLCVVTIDMCV